MLLGVQFCLHGEKDILGGVCSSRARGRFCSSILVGLWRNHSDPVHRVVGGLQKRVVLKGKLVSRAAEFDRDVSGLVRCSSARTFSSQSACRSAADLSTDAGS